MDQYLYKCQYCGKEYKPRRRHKQKYCSNSCRVTAFKLKQKSNVPKKIKSDPQDQKENKESMSLAGIANSTVGVLIYEKLKDFWEKEENKSATKADMKEFLDQVKALLNEMKERYLPVSNVPTREDGALPFYDTQTRKLIYKLPLPKLEVPTLTPINSLF